jgi:hypothetical protein
MRSKYTLFGTHHRATLARHRAVSYTPQQNGVTERMNKTLLERAVACFQMPGCLETWVVAINTACYVVNQFNIS